MDKYYHFILVITILTIPLSLLADDDRILPFPYNGVKAIAQDKEYQAEKYDSCLTFYSADFENFIFYNNARFGSTSFYSRANFRNARFKQNAYFGNADFFKDANFDHSKIYGAFRAFMACFHKEVSFNYVNFNNSAHFIVMSFKDTVRFQSCNFSKKYKVDFTSANFYKDLIVRRCEFNGNLYFNYAHWDSGDISFTESKVNNEFSFLKAKVHARVLIEDVVFHKIAPFNNTIFYQKVRFNNVEFRDNLYFKLTRFYNTLDLRGITTPKVIDFNRTLLADTVLLGQENSTEKISVDFSKTNFVHKGTQLQHTKNDTTIMSKARGVKIILYGPVNITMQPEKLSYIQIFDKLDYYSKKDIVTALQINDNIRDRTEWELKVDQLFAQSTKYQKRTTTYELYPIYHPRRIVTYLYDITMGLGYVPFRLFIWGIAIILVFTLIQYFLWHQDVYAYLSYIHKTDEPNMFEPSFFLFLFFSTKLFLSLKFEKNVILMFRGKVRLFLVFEWVLGILFYWYLLNGSRSGSLIHSLKVLFSI